MRRLSNSSARVRDFLNANGFREPSSAVSTIDKQRPTQEWPQGVLKSHPRPSRSGSVRKQKHGIPCAYQRRWYGRMVVEENLPKFCQIRRCNRHFMPPSRRTGSSESDQYFKSNRAAVGDKTVSNLTRNRTLSACGTTSELCRVMNPSGRYYKLNLQNLASGRQPTIEFRQHSGTSNFEKISTWVRFCMAIVTNSSQFKEPSALKKSRTLDEQLEMLFEYVIKDRALRDTFRLRQTAVLGDNSEAEACCSGCAHGGTCASRQVQFLPNSVS